MKAKTAGRFKKHCFKVMDEVCRSHEPMLITKKGKPIAKLVPADAEMSRDFLGCLRNKFRIVGDITSPVVPLEDWGALRE